MRKLISRRRAAALGVAALLLASACGSSDGSESASPATDGAVATTDQVDAPEPVMVPIASGGQLDFNSLRGQDVLLWFWAPW